VIGQTSARQSAGQFGFRGRDARGFNPFGRGTDCRRLESRGVEFAGRSPPRDQYETSKCTYKDELVISLVCLVAG
jgi:hypothetical protein